MSACSRLRPTFVVLALAFVFACCAAVTSARASQQVEQKVVYLQPTAKLRAKLLASFLRANSYLSDDEVDGPLWGAACADALRERSRRKCIIYFRYGRQYYADALFSVGGDQADIQTFRRPTTGLWRTIGGFGYTPPLPCPVRRAFGRQC